jgi:hypothetical protein
LSATRSRAADRVGDLEEHAQPRALQRPGDDPRPGNQPKPGSSPSDRLSLAVIAFLTPVARLINAVPAPVVAGGGLVGAW